MGVGLRINTCLCMLFSVAPRFKETIITRPPAAFLLKHPSLGGVHTSTTTAPAQATGTEDGRRRLLWQRSSGSQSDELNAVYVAATRPHTVLLLSRDLSRLALGLHRRHVQLVGAARGRLGGCVWIGEWGGISCALAHRTGPGYG